jgi:hypothetical protein
LGGEEREHGFEDGGVDGSGGVVVEINAGGHDYFRVTGVRRGKNCAQWEGWDVPAFFVCYEGSYLFFRRR